MSKIKQNSWDALTALINDSMTIVLCTHINSDGDGLGSEIAFYYYLTSLGKKCRIINPTPLPDNYQFIDPDLVVECYSSDDEDWLDSVDLSIIFDIGDFRRVGKLAKHIYGIKPSVSIDHHPHRDEAPFDIDLVDCDAPATGYLIWKYFQHMEYASNSMPLKVANSLYTSIVTDTGSFKYQSTTSDLHNMAAQLIECGVQGYLIQKEIYEKRKLSQIKLLGKVISGMQFSSNRKVSWVLISQEMINHSKGSDDDTEGLTDFMRSIDNVEISFLILEKKDGNHRINFRSSGNHTVNDIAALFNGGGHKFAAGASVEGVHIEEIEQMILNEISTKIKGEFVGN
tara:strand:- start:469 stop:1491 length:1023 start_codon:yes stop_codon:yes gene_type:complete